MDMTETQKQRTAKEEMKQDLLEKRGAVQAEEDMETKEHKKE